MSEYPYAVAIRDRASGRFLSAGAAWSDLPTEAMLLAEGEAADVVRRFACEPFALELVALDDECRAVA